MAFPTSTTSLASPYADLSEGTRFSITRLRQLMQILTDDRDSQLWPLAIVNIATSLEWYTRSLIKLFIDYAVDRVNPEAKLLRELKISYSVVLQAHNNQFTIGDIVAISRNFSSFDEIDQTVNDLLFKRSEGLLNSLREIFQRSRYSKDKISEELNSMFRKRHELVHGTPRHLSYEDQLDGYVTKKELLKYASYCLGYIQNVNLMIRNHVPELNERSTSDINNNQYARLEVTEKRIEALEQAIDRRIDPSFRPGFLKAQRAWRLWRSRESNFQTAEWLSGTGRTAVYMGYETTFNLQRVRSLEAYLRELDRMDRLG